MGSVGEDYRCPWCGRVGAGGYAPDWVGYPICTEGPHSCLWWVDEARGWNLTRFRIAQLQTIWCIRDASGPLAGLPPILQATFPLVAEFLGDGLRLDEETGMLYAWEPRW